VEHNGWASKDVVYPNFNSQVVFECKYELDSLAAFLQLSHDYYSRTRDSEFFRRGRWVDTVDAIIAATSQLLDGTYSPDGKVLISAFSFSRTTDTASETLSNKGVGAPVKGGTGLIRSFFRPSDDSCIFQLFVPANMMMSRYLEACARIMGEIDLDKAGKMKEFAASIRRGIEKYGRVKHPDYGVMYAYEVDGFGSQALMVRRPTRNWS
jgi:meiotically up-regulated gene 157 (Mug157) protein